MLDLVKGQELRDILLIVEAQLEGVAHSLLGLGIKYRYLLPVLINQHPLESFRLYKRPLNSLTSSQVPTNLSRGIFDFPAKKLIKLHLVYIISCLNISFLGFPCEKILLESVLNGFRVFFFKCSKANVFEEDGFILFWFLLGVV